MPKQSHPDLEAKTALITVPGEVHQWLQNVKLAGSVSLRTVYQLVLRFAMDHDKEFRDYVTYHMRGVTK